MKWAQEAIACQPELENATASNGSMEEQLWYSVRSHESLGSGATCTVRIIQVDSWPCLWPKWSKRRPLAALPLLGSEIGFLSRGRTIEH